jgi:hypothetical protein
MTFPLRPRFSKRDPLFSITFPRRPFIFKVTTVSPFAVEKTSCPRLLCGRRVPPTRTPVRFSRQSAVARSRKATHNPCSQSTIHNSGFSNALGA